jgi:hypothetical protein
VNSVVGGWPRPLTESWPSGLGCGKGLGDETKTGIIRVTGATGCVVTVALVAVLPMEASI